MKRAFSMLPVLAVAGLLLAWLAAAPTEAFAQHTSSGSSGGSSGGASAGGGSSTGSSTSSGSSSGGSASHAGSGGGHSSAAGGGVGRSATGGGDRGGSGGTHTATGRSSAWAQAPAQQTTQGVRSNGSSGFTQAVPRAGVFTKDSPLVSVPPFSRPFYGPPVGHAIPRPAAPGATGGTTGVLPGFYAPGWGYGYFGYGLPGGIGLYNYYGGFGGGFFGDISDGFFGSGYSGAYGTYDPYASESASTALPRGEAGGLRLKVKPDNASVYVDGGYVGLVNQYDGMFHKLRLDPGNHKVEMRAPGYETLTFNVRIEPNRTETYRGELEKGPQ